MSVIGKPNLKIFPNICFQVFSIQCPRSIWWEQSFARLLCERNSWSTLQQTNFTDSTNISLAQFSSPTYCYSHFLGCSLHANIFNHFWFSYISAVFSKPSRSTVPEIPTSFIVAPLSESETELSKESESNLDTPDRQFLHYYPYHFLLEIRQMFPIRR